MFLTAGCSLTGTVFLSQLPSYNPVPNLEASLVSLYSPSVGVGAPALPAGCRDWRSASASPLLRSLQPSPGLPRPTPVPGAAAIARQVRLCLKEGKFSALGSRVCILYISTPSQASTFAHLLHIFVCLFCFLLAAKIAPEDKKVQKYIDLSFLSQLMQKRPCHLSSLLLYLLIQLFDQQF